MRRKELTSPAGSITHIGMNVITCDSCVTSRFGGNFVPLQKISSFDFKNLEVWLTSLW